IPCKIRNRPLSRRIHNPLRIQPSIGRIRHCDETLPCTSLGSPRRNNRLPNPPRPPSKRLDYILGEILIRSIGITHSFRSIHEPQCDGAVPVGDLATSWNSSSGEPSPSRKSVSLRIHCSRDAPRIPIASTTSKGSVRNPMYVAPS